MEAFKTMKKNSEITEDDLKNCEKEIQNLTDKSVRTLTLLFLKRNMNHESLRSE